MSQPQLQRKSPNLAYVQGTTPVVLQIAFVAISTLSLTCMYVKAWILQYNGPPAEILRHRTCSRRKNKFVSVVNLEELTFDVFDRTKVTYTVK